MTAKTQVGSTLKAFDLYGRAWLNHRLNREVASTHLGCVEVQGNSGCRHRESYALFNSQDYWFLQIEKGDGIEFVAVQYVKHMLPVSPLQAAEQILCELWQLRSPSKLKLRRVERYSGLGKEAWLRVQKHCSHVPLIDGPRAHHQNFEAGLLRQGHGIELVRGVMGTTEHIVRFGNSNC